jgi:hypothetical protein
VISRIHRQLGTAGFVISIMALIAALVGGAYAASGGFSAKEKREIRKIAKRVAKPGRQGPAGAPGVQGLPGAEGSKGDKGDTGEAGKDGTNGSNGTNGTNGESVSIIPLTADNGSGNCEDGGAKFVNGTGQAFACNGTSGGGGGYPDTLPSGKTATGLWEVLGESSVIVADAAAASMISFPLPLASEPTEMVLIDSDATTEEKEKCPGGTAEPKATAGVLCLYLNYPADATLSIFGSGLLKVGAIIYFGKTDKAFGSWAVKAP